LSRLNDLIDPILIEYTLQASDHAAIRRCKLTAEYLVWLVVGLALFGITTILHVGASSLFDAVECAAGAVVKAANSSLGHVV